MFLAIFPFRYYKPLPDFTLINRIRQRSWNLDRIFPRIKSAKAELRNAIKNIGHDPSNLMKARSALQSLSQEVRAGIKDLKFINFYDSTLLYLYYRLLRHVLELCNREHYKLSEEREKAVSEKSSLSNQKIENIKEEKERIKKSIDKYEKLLSGFDDAKKRLSEVYDKLLEELRRRRWDAEKQAQHEFALLNLTLRSMENLSRKIKIEAIKVKTRIVPQKAALMRRIEGKKAGEINPEDVIMIAKLVSEAVDRISKDVAYSFKLIAKFEKEIENMQKIVENLKNTINNSFKGKEKKETAIENITKPWDDIVKNLEAEIDRDLMQIFRNIFVELNYIGRIGKKSFAA